MFIRSMLMGIVLSSAFSHACHANQLPTAYFKCGETLVMADFHDETKLDLTIGRMTYILSVAPSGSGARYETPKGTKPYIEFWNKGREATIQVDDKKLPHCSQVEAPKHKLLSSAKEWHVNKINDKAPIPGSRLVVKLGDKGQLSGFSGCNQFRGHYELKGEELKFKGPMASTEMACVKKEMMKQESHFMSLLQSMTKARIMDGKDLELSNESGQTILLIGK
jgi:heat shock protein HslJ